MVKPRRLNIEARHQNKDPRLLERATRLAQRWGRRPARLNTVCDPGLVQLPEWEACRLQAAPPDSWQHAHVLYGLRQLGCVHSQAHGLGIACAHETLLYRLAGEVAQVRGIDVYDDRSGYEDAGMPDDPARFAPFPYPTERLQVKRWCAGQAYPFAADSFDFAWSVSSIEHFGPWSHKELALREAARVLKPGGVLAFTTELVVSQERFRGVLKLSRLRFEKEYFTRSDLETLLGAAPQLQLVEDVNWAADEDTLNSTLTHSIHGLLYLPIALFLRKRGGA